MNANKTPASPGLLELTVSVANPEEASWLWLSEGHETPIHGVRVESIRELSLPQVPVFPQAPGYHLRPIAKGTLGEWSKVAEEYEEFMEAIEQGVTLMALLELADMLGATEEFLSRRNLLWSVLDMEPATAPVDLPGFDRLTQAAQNPEDPEFLATLSLFWSGVLSFTRGHNLNATDIVAMKEVTSRAFESGHRS